MEPSETLPAEKKFSTDFAKPERSVSFLLEKQRAYFSSGATQSIKFRREQLLKLKSIIQHSELEISSALALDLGKPAFEAYTTEIGMVLEELKFIYKKLPSWGKTCKTQTPLALFPAKSYIYHEPFGVCLIISPWNYPFQLALSPLLGAIAAGNCSIIKPSEYSPNTSKVIADLIHKNFPLEYIAVVEGDNQIGQELLRQSWDFIFFTGGPNIAKLVMSSASEHLTPVILELGGKSPCLVDEKTDITLTARRIIWGKFLNAGQTCVAPDYVLCHEKVKESLISEMIQSLKNFYGENPQLSPDYGRIIGFKHFDRLEQFLNEKNCSGKIISLGKNSRENRYFAPTIIDEPSWNDLVMKEEIFGPILPILSFTDWTTTFSMLKKMPRPLAAYLFSTNKKLQKKIIEELSCGGICLNDTVLHLANPSLPFGGIGMSGLGQYHGKASFEAFSHKKSVLKKFFFLDIPLRYPPYLNKLKWAKKFLG